MIATASTNTGNRHPVRRLLIPGIMILVGILGILSWLSDDETTRHTTTPVISNLEKTAPPTGNKSAAEVTAVVTGEATTKPAAASIVQTDNWSPTSRPGWPESGSNKQKTQDSTSNEETPPQDQLQQQGSGVATRVYRPPTPRPGYQWPGYGYYPQQPLQQQPRYQPAYSQPYQLQ